VERLKLAARAVLSADAGFLVLHTSTFSAFQVSYKNALYKSTVIIIILEK